MAPKTHELKCWTEFFEEIIAGRKTHDLRRSNDRNFEIGDRLHLQEWDHENFQYTGRIATAEVTYITDENAPCAYSAAALLPGFCILSIALMKAEEAKALDESQ